MQQTLILLKPDAIHRRLAGAILQRFEQKGLRLVGLKLVQPDRPLAEKHYAVHKGKPFYESLLQFLTSGPSLAVVLEGREAVTVVREMMGKTVGAGNHSRRLRHQRSEQPDSRQRQRRKRRGRDRPMVQAD